MAQTSIKNNKYGILSSGGEMHILKKMGVSANNIVNISNGDRLIKSLAIGDTLCVPSVASFARGGYELFSKIQYLSNNSIEFKSGNESYLNFSSIKPLSITTLETLRTIAQHEYEFMRWIQSVSLDRNFKTQLLNKIGWENITMVSLMFGNNGIKKKGS